MTTGRWYCLRDTRGRLKIMSFGHPPPGVSPKRVFSGASQESDENEQENDSDSEKSKDERQKTLTYIYRRRGQKPFRQALLATYDYRCVITDCDAESALEACHILPYKGEQTNLVTNGLLLRADIHTLFDLQLIAIDEDTNDILIAECLKKTTYEYLTTKSIRMPTKKLDWPDKGALRKHRRDTGL